MPHRQNFRPLGAGQSLTAIECCGRSAVEQAGSVEQGVFEAQVFDLNTLGRLVMVDGAVEGGTVFSGVMGWIGDDFFSFCSSWVIKEPTHFATKRRVAAVRRLVDRSGASGAPEGALRTATIKLYGTMRLLLNPSD